MKKELEDEKKMKKELEDEEKMKKELEEAKKKELEEEQRKNKELEDEKMNKELELGAGASPSPSFPRPVFSDIKDLRRCHPRGAIFKLYKPYRSLEGVISHSRAIRRRCRRTGLLHS
jgi:hypothetical protein